MKIRLLQPGFETYTGQMGVTFFEDGLTTAPVDARDATRLAAQFLCEWEDGSNVSITQTMLDHAHNTTHSIPPPINADQALAQENGIPHITAPVQGKLWTKEQLEAVVDAKGINGLREIAEPMGVKGKAIVELIAEILAKQAV